MLKKPEYLALFCNAWFVVFENYPHSTKEILSLRLDIKFTHILQKII